MSDVKFTTKLKGASDVARLLNRYPDKVGRTLESLVKPTPFRPPPLRSKGGFMALPPKANS